MLVDPENESPEQEDSDEASTPQSSLVSWVMANVNPWRDFRDSNHKAEWDEYYRKWRAKYADGDKTRNSERSQIITPATMQAVDSTVAEIEEAIFGREQWFDIDEDVKNSMNPDAVKVILEERDQLLEEADKNKVPTNVSKAVLFGTIWGTGVGKIHTSEKKAKRLVRDESGAVSAQTRTEVAVGLVPLEPYEVVPDPTTDNIDEMLGIAHETVLPMHRIREMQNDGVYFKDAPLAAYTGEYPQGPKLTDMARPQVGRAVHIVEWHGKVPAKYLIPIIDSNVPAEVLQGFKESDEEDNLVEAIVTIANKSTLLGARKNPYLMGDRDIIAYQHDTVPGYFWGRGVPEKASNSQRTLDATLRARIDAMALVTVPMMAGDVTRLPRGFNLSVWPGKFWPTSGAPGDVIQGINLGGQVSPDLFSHAQDAERMVSTATGAMDPAGDYNPNGQSATNTALNRAAFLKRAKRAMRNIENNFLQPLVTKMLWRYTQFAPDKFQGTYDFRTRSALGIMAREFEQQQLTQLLSLVQPESKPALILLKAVFDNSSSPHKSAMVQAVDALVNPPPPTPEQQAQMKFQQQLQLRGQVAAVAELEARGVAAQAKAKQSLSAAHKSDVDAAAKAHEVAHESDSLDLEYIRAVADMRKAVGLEQQNAESDLSTQVQAQKVALAGLDKGISANRIANQAHVLIDAANDGMDMVPGTQDDEHKSGI